MRLSFVSPILCYNYVQSFHESPQVFNHAEESLQDGSHLFSTQHPVAPTYAHCFIYRRVSNPHICQCTSYDQP